MVMVTTWEAEVPETQLFRLGADVGCADGHCGRVRSLVIDLAQDAVTHLLVEPGHERGLARLVPVSLVEAADGAIRLRCTTAEYERLDSPDETDTPPGLEGREFYAREPLISWPYYSGGAGMFGGMGAAIAGVTQSRATDAVAEHLPGEEEVPRGEHVHATDGDIGRVQGVTVDAGTGRVSSVLLREGHLLGRRDVLVPRDAVAEVDADGFHLSITRQQVRDLPSAGSAPGAGRTP
jgi:sporulation protein YlmC with PRC-barrel domain